MISPVQNVTIFAANGSEANEISAVVCTLGNVNLNRQDITLSMANGTAHALAASGETILFRTTGSSDQDEQAVQELCQNAGPNVRIIAISDADLPLTAARRLLHAGVADILPMPLTKNDLSESFARLEEPVKIAATAVPPQSSRRGKLLLWPSLVVALEQRLSPSTLPTPCVAKQALCAKKHSTKLQW